MCALGRAGYWIYLSMVVAFGTSCYKWVALLLLTPPPLLILVVMRTVIMTVFPRLFLVFLELTYNQAAKQSVADLSEGRKSVHTAA